METSIKSIISFEEFLLDPLRRILKKDDKTVSLNPKTLDLLIVLIEKAGAVVEKNELLDKVWTDQFVEENNLTVHVAALRKALGEKKGEHKFIVTVPGRGYSFVAEIRQDALENNSLAPLQTFNLENPNELKGISDFDRSSALIGRARELAEIKNLLLSDAFRLITLTGTGGSGKTTLARAVGNDVSGHFADGVFFVELVAADNADLAVSVIAQTFGVKESGDKSLVEAMVNYLRDKRILLILDNFEQILSAAPFVRKLINSTEHLKILVTSRAPMRVNGEHEMTVAPLDVPPRELILSGDNLNDYASTALFARRAQDTRRSFALTDDVAQTISEICRRLDGLPLAIELAAARVKLLAPQAILARLENSLKLLTGGARDLPERQRTMRDAIRWSYDLLERDEQILFRRLSVFRGGFTVEAAEFLAEENGGNLPVASAPVLDLLTSLADNNLLILKQQNDENARLQMLEVVREFAFEVLQETMETENARRVHAEFFLRLAEEAEPLLHGEKGKEWHEKLDTEHDNLRAALGWSLENAPEIAARIAAALRFFWLNRSYMAEGMRWTTAALNESRRDFSPTRGVLLLACGQFQKKSGNLHQARRCYEEVLEKSVEIGDSILQMRASHGLAAVAVIQKDFKSARKHSEKSLAICREIGDQRQTAFSLCALGDLEMSERNQTAAKPLFEECLEISRKISDDRLLMVTLYNLGTANYFEKNYETATENFAESLKIAYEMKNTNMISCSLDGIAAVCAAGGKPEQAAFLNGAADSLNDSLGYTPEPADEIFRNDYIKKTRLTLGENLYNTVYEQGRNLKSEEIIANVAAPRLSGDTLNANEVSHTDEGVTEIVIEKYNVKKITITEEIED